VSVKKIIFILLIFILPALLPAQDPVNWTKHIISDSLEGAKKNVVVNLDNDDDKNMDIVVTANPEENGPEDDTKANVIWFKNTGAEVFQQYNIDLKHVGARGLAVGDLTGNGYPDIAAGSRNADSSAVWYKNDGTPDEGLWQRIKIGGPAPNDYNITIIDLDNDGDLDIIDGIGDDIDSIGLGSGIFTDSLRWFENLGGSDTAAFTTHLIAQYSSPSGIAAADFDDDGDIDVASMAWLDYSNPTPVADEDVRWWAQGPGQSWTQQQVIQQFYAGSNVAAADLDQNGTIDLIGAGYKTESIDWWSNNGGGTFSSINVIASNFVNSRNVAVADIDGDGDSDIAAAADNQNKISWFENDGSQNFTQHDVNCNFSYAYYVTAADLDGDGDVDLIATAQNDNELSWWENDLAEEQNITAGDPDPVYFNDGKLVIDFKAGFSGGDASVFFNHGKNSIRDSIGSGLDHIAVKGYYTIVTNASSYEADIVFYYSGIPEWENVSDDENDLKICYWDENSGTSGRWLTVGSLGQIVDTSNNKIIVPGLSSELEKYSLFTLGSVSIISSIEDELISFRTVILNDGLRLQWETENETDNMGFELWRKSGQDIDFHLQASYLTDENLKGSGSANYGKEYQYIDRFVRYGQTYTYKLMKVGYDDGKFEYKKITIDYIPQNIVKINSLEIPEKIQLYQNYPNPFNSGTMIEFSVPVSANTQPARVRLDIFNLLGQKIKSLYNGELIFGRYLLHWDGKNEVNQQAASGMYVYRLIVNEKVLVKRLSLLK
jgi:hypothetical protein